MKGSFTAKSMSSQICHIMTIIVIVVMTYLMIGCKNKRLSMVEHVMESDIELADSILYSIQKPSGKRNLALYALLKSQIDYKMYRDASNDSIIRLATNFYGKKYKSYHAAMVWYSLGCISTELGNDSVAVDAYLTAIHLFPDTLIRYYALTEQNLSCIYLNHKMDAEAISMIKSCLINAIRLNDSTAIAFCEFNIARYLLYNNEYDKAEELFLELKDNKWMSPSTKDDPYLELSKIAQVKESDFIKSLNYVDSFLNRNEHLVPYDHAYSIKADAYYGLAQIDSAQLYYDLALSEATDPYIVCDAYRRLSEIHSLKGNKESAAYYAKQASAWMDTIASATDSGTLYRIINRYSSKSFQPKNKRVTYLITIAVLLSILAIVVTAFTHIKNKRKHVKSVLDYANDIDEFRDSDLFIEMVNVVHNQVELSSKDKNILIKRFSQSLIGLREFIIKSSTQMSCMEIDYCIYTILGFKQKDFVLFYNISPSGSRNIKARIREKMPEQLFNNIFS